MKFTLYNIGKTDVDYLREGIDDFTKRIKRFIDFSIIDLPDIKHTKNTTPEELSVREGENIIRAVSASNLIVLFDEKGKELNTRDFAGWLEKIMSQSYKNVAFVTGGAYGFSEPVYGMSNQTVSLSRMTFTHQMVRLIFVEQLYRAITIIRGIPYHND